MTHLPVLVLGTALAVALGTTAPAQDAESGAVLFLDHCATCHGVAAEGDGPMTAILSVQPPDLTQLARAEGGTFPLERVVRRIDGRDEVLAHGGPMPVFGMILGTESGLIDAFDGTPVFTTQAVVDIAAWLQTVQK
ncbi:c-type cytochrome [Palleronia sp. KMU-117]|uniref:c-type cytochrome n=1 Tax=Palleronia sp. KMU-117 TaxID=3434108 RepID=UPI003D74B364